MFKFDYDVGYVERHIDHIFNIKNKSEIIKKLKDPDHFLKIKEILSNIDSELLKGCDDFYICSTKQIASFYWVYKVNYEPWHDLNNFIIFMNDFKDLFVKNKDGLYCDCPNEMMFSLTIVFYFDRQVHS